MLRNILSITGRPGLVKIVSRGNRSLIVEDLQSGKRFPAQTHDKIVSLGDISMYTMGEDKPLGEIMDLVYAKHEGKPIDVKALAANGGLEDAFAEILPDFDRDRVYKTDIKKLFTWYNILLAAGFTEFAEKKESEAEAEESAETEESK